MIRTPSYLGFILMIVCSCALAQSPVLVNPLLPSGADPYSFYKDGFYYYTHTTGRNITIWKAKSLSQLHLAEKKIIFEPPPNTMYSKNIWAPQIQFLRGKWYAYFAADDGKNINHRMYALENSSADPMEGDWIFKGKVADAEDKWAIDGDVFEYDKNLYMIWSGWEGNADGQQDLYIAKMTNPWTIDGKRVRISSPTHPWEKFGDLKGNPSHVDVNEGPQFLKNGNKIFIVYSASGCWTDNYSLGLLSFKGSRDLLDSSSWVKHADPVFTQQPGIGVYAPGHNSFFKSPDGKEDWILYHANSEPGQGCGRFRSPRAQPFTWNADSTPHFGAPVAKGVTIAAPSGARYLERHETPMNDRDIDTLVQDSAKHLYLADPTVYAENGMYYLYGTVEQDASKGFLVYTSRNLNNWQLSRRNEGGYALRRGEAYGSKGFWAPQVFTFQGKYYMAYVANENIAIAESDHPEGPFRQAKISPIAADVKQIDPYVYIDTDGRKYLYHVRLQEGNRLFVAELEDDFSAIKRETLRECFAASEPWENTAGSAWPVAEGPVILKRGSLYYFVYTANDFRNPDYAVGFASGNSPLGPWKKSNANPILSKKQLGINGTGHGDMFVDRHGNLQYVFHTHFSNSRTGPRRTAIIRAGFDHRNGDAQPRLVFDHQTLLFPTVSANSSSTGDSSIK